MCIRDRSQAVFELLLASGLGADLNLEAVHEDAFTALFSESASRVLIAVSRDRVDAALERAAAVGVPAVVVGETSASGKLSFGDQEVAVDELAQAWAATLPQHFGHSVAPNAAV